ncbi:MAG: DUF6470 family protein [Lysinibacillus sp.]
MRLPQISIRTTDAKIDLDISKSRQYIKQPQATQKIEQPAAILDIRTTKSVLKIDSSQARRDLGLVGPLESSANFAQKGKQVALRGITRIAREGQQMMENAGKGQGNAIIQSIAKQNHGPKPMKFNVKFLPSVGSVKINYTPGTTEVNFTRQNPKINTQVNKPIHEYTPGKVTSTMVQRPDVQIDVIG